MKSSGGSLSRNYLLVAFLLLSPGLLLVQPTLAQSNKGDNAGVAHRLKKLEQLVAQLQATNTQQQSEIGDLKEQLVQETLARQAVESKLQFVSIVHEPINGLSGPHMIVEGCNLHVRSGSGDSTDGTLDSGNLYVDIPNTNPTGLGNLIVGYNETPQYGAPERTGSHNLVVGPGHNFTNVGGVVFGEGNYATGPFTSALGGTSNIVSGMYASVLGGLLNRASARITTVTGGFSNDASGYLSSVGGYKNTSSGDYSSVCGGRDNTASGAISCISGGAYNTASGGLSSVSGGQGNAASGYISTVSGGYGRTAPGDLDWVAGALFQDS